MAPDNVQKAAGATDRAAAARPGLLRRLRIRAKLYLAFSAISGLVIAAAIAAVIWMSHSDGEILRRMSLAQSADWQTTAAELELMTMSDAVRGYLLDPTSQAEVLRKLAADDRFAKVVEKMQATLPALPGVLRLMTEIETFHTRILSKIEGRLVELATRDPAGASRFYQTDYLPQRQLEIGLLVVLHHEVATVRAAVRAKAAWTYVRQLILGLCVAVTVLLLSGLLAWLCARLIGDQIRGMTTAMGKLADGDISTDIPALDAEDEIGDMARAVGVFRADAIARHQGEATLLRTNLQLNAALNNMLQGMQVWGPDHQLQLVNERFLTIYGLPPDSIGPGSTVREVVDAVVRLGWYADRCAEVVCAEIIGRLTAQLPTQVEMATRSGKLVRITYQPMSNGGTVVTFEDLTETRRRQEQIVFMAHHDALTDLPNRTLFQEHLEVAVARLVEGRQFAVLCLDLDHFKDINDTLGHAAGDELLRLVTARLRHCVREGDMVARLGGDDFAIVLDGSADVADSAARPNGAAGLGGAVGDPAPAAALAARLVEAIGSPYELRGHNIVIGTSIGIALCEPGVPGAEFLKRADVALYRAKKQRGTFVFYEPRMDAQLIARHELEADLRLAVQRNEFELHYQPLYNFAEDRVTGFEALVRWNSPTRGRVSPADFIPLAEQTDLIIPIGEWVLRTACAEAANWPDHVSVAVNLSPVQFKSKRLMALVREVLEATGLPARRLELEITETVLLQDVDAVMEMLHSLHDLGVLVSMDDFGTGYSSLSYLLRFPFDKVKIDRSFISELGASLVAPAVGPLGDAGAAATGPATLSASARNAAIIVRAIIGLGANLGIATLAEGVETEEQFAQIRRKGCTEVQGYFLSRPLPASEIEAVRLRLDATLPKIVGPKLAGPKIAGGRHTLPKLVA